MTTGAPVGGPASARTIMVLTACDRMSCVSRTWVSLPSAYAAPRTKKENISSLASWVLSATDGTMRTATSAATPIRRRAATV
ncbi:hypothetical protein ABZ734_15210 [Streptomyces sp. NPDC006660]|uniref:hypothetical protein n=1 Tax=Streptomyces sp. NPDC006660 TaxID=3156901 RepID=UPI0033D35518